MTQPTCKTCRFFHGPVSRNGHLLGECRKHTPRHVDPIGFASWPVTRPNDWCGEHAPAKTGAQSGM